MDVVAILNMLLKCRTVYMPGMSLAEFTWISTELNKGYLIDLLGKRVGDGAALLCKGLEHNTTLTSLCLQGNEVSGAVAKKMSSVLSVHPALTDLNLSENCIDDRGGVALAELTVACTTLQTLHLWGNRLGAPTGVAFGSCLEAPTCTLTSLSLWNNALDDGCAEVLSRGLSTNRFLVELCLDHNKFGAGAGVYLGAALVTNSSLRKLSLWNNLLRDEGVVALAEGLKKNTTLELLSVAMNDVGDAGAHAVASLMAANCSLREVDFAGNDFHEDILLPLAHRVKCF